MTALAANMFWLFTEAGPRTADRVRAAAAAGVAEVEIWGWRHEDLDALEAALVETGVLLRSLIVDPQLQITDPATHDDYVVAVRESLAVAQRLGSPNLVAVAGDELAGVPRAQQHDAVVAALTRAAAEVEGSEVTILLENLNTEVDHPGTYLSSTREGLDIVGEVGSPRVALLLDAYHAVMMGEEIRDVIGDDIATVGHVQVADAPGRHEPGSADVDWDRILRDLRELGYAGSFGMEYMPLTETVASLTQIRSIIDSIDGTS